MPDETDAALAAFGLAREAQDTIAPFKVYRCNWDTLFIFCATWPQWRKIPGKDRLFRECIDWTQVESALNLNGIKRTQWPMIFVGLHAMQHEAIDCLSRDGK